MNRSALFRALRKAHRHLSWARLTLSHEPGDYATHLRKARVWLEAARAIREVGL